MNKFRTVLLVAIIATSNLHSVAHADTDPFPGVSYGAEIGPRQKVSSSTGNPVDGAAIITCPAGAGLAGVADGIVGNYVVCTKTWRPSADVNADATFRSAQEAAVAAATAESQAWNAANPGKQKCIQWGPIVHANGVSTASGGVCANPVAPGAGATVPSQSSDAVVGPTTAPSATSSSTPAVIPTNETSITGNGSPYTKILPGQLSTAQCPAGFQAANGIIVAIGTGTFTECWPDLAWKANRLGGTYWEQFKASGGTYDVTAVIDALSVIADYKVRAKAVAQAAADLTPGTQRCSTWSVYGQSGEECAYAFIQPTGTVPGTDSRTATTGSDTSTVITTPAIDTATAQSINTSNLDTSTAVVALVPIPATAVTESQTTSAAAQIEAAANSDEVATGDISARQFKGKVVFSVDSSLEKSELTITATKKNGKTIQIALTTNSNGERNFSQSVNLAGYTLTLKSGDQVLDKFVLKK